MNESIYTGMEKLEQYVSEFLGGSTATNTLKDCVKLLSSSKVDKNKSLVTTKSDEMPLFNDDEVDELFNQTRNRLINKELQRQKNINSIVDKTSILLKDETKVSQEPVDKDWITRFFDCAQDFSNEKMQILWSKILAGEIKNPGSFSLRLLDSMAKISQEEAQLFEKYGLYMTQTGTRIFIMRDDKLNEKYNISYDDILVLQECNLIDANPLLSLDFAENAKEKSLVVIHYHGQCITIEMTKGKKISLPVYQLTRLGKELFQIANIKYDTNYFRDVAQYIANNNKDKTVLLYKTYVLAGNNILPVGEPDKIVSE